MISKLILIIFFFFGSVNNNYCQKNYISNDDGYDIISDSTGYYVKDNNFNSNNLITKNSWTGEWIWLNALNFKEYQETQIKWKINQRYLKQYKALFRKSFDLATMPNQVFMSITADVSFRVYINETFVAQGPANIGNDYFDGLPPKHWFYNTHNIKKHLNVGKNTISVEVYSHFREISETSSGQGMFICDIEDGTNKNIVSTDTSWKGNIDTSFSLKDGLYFFNANNEVKNLSKKTFDDSSWKYVSIKNIPKKDYLIISNIPIPFRYPIKPKRIMFGNNEISILNFPSMVYDKSHYKEEFTLDYEKNLTAYYGFTIIAHKNDTIKIYPYEKNLASQNRTLIFVCKEGINTFYAPYLSVFRYLKIEVVSKNGLVIKDIQTDFSTYPVNYKGSFDCSDHNLTKLWNITRWTTQLCMNDMFYDSPKHQEPIACTGDYFIQSLINYYAFGDKWLTRQTLHKTALMLAKNNYYMFHTSYSLLWVQMLHKYYLYTGDIQILEELLPHVNKLNQLFETYLDSDFLVSNAPNYMFMDWVKIEGYNAHHPPAVIGMGYMTAFYYKSLLDAAYMNNVIGNTSFHNKNMELAKKIKTAMNNLLWDKEKKLYKDGIPFKSKRNNYYFFPEDTKIVTYSPHVNTLAVLYDIVPENQHLDIMNYVVNQKSVDLQPYFMFFVLSAIEHIGVFSTHGLELLKKWENGINTETFTLKENWQDKTESGYAGDYSHAWGGSPLYFMSRNILGVTPSIPGYKEIEIQLFENENINWAKGRVPLLNGNSIGINWKKESESKYIYILEIPVGQKCFMSIPKYLRKNDFRINNKKYSKDKNRVQLISGTYEIEFEK